MFFIIEGVFNIMSDGSVTVAGSLDYEFQQIYNLVIEVRDGGNPSRQVTTPLTVGLIDINDNAPQFDLNPGEENLSVLEVRLVKNKLL